MKKTALVILTDGVEELEAVAPIDVLRRAGVECVLASQTNEQTITGRNGLILQAETLLSSQLEETFDLVLLPGGPGTSALVGDERVLSLTRAQHERGGWLGAICAAPMILQMAGILEGRVCTGHASIVDALQAEVRDEEVVVDKNIVTSRGAGTSIAFGLTLVRLLCGEEVATSVASSIHYRE